MSIQTLLIDLEPFSSTETAGDALRRMADENVTFLPVTAPDGSLAAVVGEAALLDISDPQTPLSEFVSGLPLSVPPDTHAIDAAQVMQVNNLEILPVVDESDRYRGIIERKALFGQLAHMVAAEQPGAIVVLNLPRRDHSLARIAHIVEENDAKVLSASSEELPGGDHVRVTLKLNVSDTARVRHILEHHDFQIEDIYDEAETDEELRERAEEFLHFLDV